MKSASIRIASTGTASKIAPIEASIVMPCLNEAETLEDCIRSAMWVVAEHDLAAEIIVADNGSNDGSAAIAERVGARVVTENRRGYGSAVRAGIAAARGKYVIIADSDGQHDFSYVPSFLAKLKNGFDLVVGNRFRGSCDSESVPWINRVIGNPLLSGLGRMFFHSPVRDFHCGMRAFRREAYDGLSLHSTGMELASEMIIVATLRGQRLTEIPIAVHKPGRSRPSHLVWWRDGWRHLRLLLFLSPTWLFLLPGITLFAVGLLSSLWLLGGPRTVGPIEMDIHTLLVTGFLCVLGFQIILLGLFGRGLALAHGLHPAGRQMERLFYWFQMEWGLLFGFAVGFMGFILLGYAAWTWEEAGFRNLDPQITMRHVIPAIVLLILGVQTVFGSFLLGVLDLLRR